MAQAPTYERSTGFAEDELANAGGRTTVRADRVDAELDDVSASINALQANQELIQRDDGELRDAIVKPHTISTAVATMFGGSDFLPRGAWVTLIAYAVNDLVEEDGVLYVCLTAHTASVFASDLASGYWMVFPGQARADTTAFTPTADIVSTNVQDAIEEVSQSVGSLNAALLAFNYGAF